MYEIDYRTNITLGHRHTVACCLHSKWDARTCGLPDPGNILHPCWRVYAKEVAWFLVPDCAA